MIYKLCDISIENFVKEIKDLLYVPLSWDEISEEQKKNGFIPYQYKHSLMHQLQYKKSGERAQYLDYLRRCSGNYQAYLNYKHDNTGKVKPVVPWNIGIGNQHIVDFGCKEDKNYDLSLEKIPVGNYYFKFYYCTQRKSVNFSRSLVGVVDLKINRNGMITVSKDLSVFISQTSVLRFEEGKKDTIDVFTARKMLNLCIIDRLKNILALKGARPSPYLMRMSIDEVFKSGQFDLGSSQNYIYRNKNRVVFIPCKLNKGNKGHGKWGFDRDAPRGDRTTISDGLNKENHPKDAHQIFCNICEKHDLLIGISSEQSSIDGNWIIMEKDLMKQRYPQKKDFSFFKDTCFGLSNNGLYAYSIFKMIEKIYPRLRSFPMSDAARIDNLYNSKWHENEILFDRSRTYLAHNKNEYGMNNLQKANTTLNALVAYVPISDCGLIKGVKEFQDYDKNELSRRLHGIDCHIRISSELSHQNIRLKRSLKEEIGLEHMTPDMRRIIEDLVVEQKLKGSILPRKIKTKEDIAYKFKCEKCGAMMFPAEVKSKELADGTIEDTYSVVEIKEKNHRKWWCLVCDNFESNAHPASINIRDKFATSLNADILDVDLDLEELGLELKLDVSLPLGVARIVSSTGLKGMSAVYSQPFVGRIKKMKNDVVFYDITDKGDKNGLRHYRDLSNANLDAHVPLATVKGGISQIGAAVIRLQNALFGTDICIDDYIKEAIDGDTDNYEQMNELLKNVPKAEIEVMTYNNDSENPRFENKIVEAYIGIEEIKVTESNEEFLSVKNRFDPMKISYNDRFLSNRLGYTKLDKAMIDNSYGRTEKDITQFLDIIDCVHGNFINRKEVFYNSLPEENAFEVNKGVRATIDSEINLEKWLKIRDKHPLFSSPLFENGAYYRFKYKDQDKIIVFPKRETLLDLVRVVSSDTIQIHGAVKILLDMFWKLGSTGTVNYYQYKDYLKALEKKLTGKFGHFAKHVAYMGSGSGSKVIACGYLPPKTIVIADNKWNKEVKKECRKYNLSYSNIQNEKISYFAKLIRDPHVWLEQSDNIVKVWSVKQANNYFKKIYGINFTNTKNFKGLCMFPNFRGMMVNNLDLVFKDQADSDGDYSRVLLNMHPDVQREMSEIWNNNNIYQNFNLLKTDSNYLKLKTVLKWHVDYLIKESKSCMEHVQIEEDKEKKSFTLEPLSITYEQFNIKTLRGAIFKGIKNKGNIGPITISMWTIGILMSYLKAQGQNAKVQINDQEMDDINNLIQTMLVQDGCIRALKAKDKFRVLDAVMDSLALDVPTIVTNKDQGIDEKVNIRTAFGNVASIYGYEHILSKFFKMLNYWKDISNIRYENGKIIKDTTLMEPQARMILTVAALLYGGSLSKDVPLTILIKECIENMNGMMERRFLNEILDHIKEIYIHQKEV